MRINNNVASLNAWRNLTGTDNMMAKNLERLSSGFRINRAADDAAGLAISERMRAQVKGMNQAIRNAQDGVSLVQTAEGALTEVHTILQRMRELAVQAANGTNTGADRNQIQTEMDELSSEITRITNTTRYNSRELLNGGMQKIAATGGGTGDLTFQIGPMANQTMTFAVSAMDASTLGVARDLREVSDNNNLITTLTNLNNIQTVPGTYDGLGNGSYTIEITYSPLGYDANGDTVMDSDYQAVLKSSAGATLDTRAFNKGASVTFNDGTDNLFTMVANNDMPVTTGVTYKAELQINRAAATRFANGAKLSDAVAIGGIDVTTEASATAAITAIDTAVNTVSAQRSQLGALQNRLEHTINNLSVVSENLVASDSRIRDVDMASEMAAFTRNQILMQAGTAMMAQANTKNQAVLELLK